MNRCVVAVDGPSGSGKSTVSRRLATALGASYLDTGAMYRAVTLAVLTAGIDPSDRNAVVDTARRARLDISTDPDKQYIRLDGADVSTEIRGPAVTGAVSAVSAVAEVRQILVAEQQRIIAEHATGIVVEGRDIATVVAPDANLKVYLTASQSERARRRSGENGDTEAATAADLERRDRLDSGRAVSPLQRAEDAITLDTTECGIDEVVQRLRDLLSEAVDAGVRR